MNIDRKVIKQALEALIRADKISGYPNSEKAITALRQAFFNDMLDRMAENARELGLDYEQGRFDAQVETAQQQEPVQTTPNFDQLKQILDNLDRCHHRDSKQEFLRTWIRDWTEHKLAKHVSPPASKPWVGLTGHEQKCLMSMNVRDAVFNAEEIEMLKEKNT